MKTQKIKLKQTIKIKTVLEYSHDMCIVFEMFGTLKSNT